MRRLIRDVLAEELGSFPEGAEVIQNRRIVKAIVEDLAETDPGVRGGRRRRSMLRSFIRYVWGDYDGEDLAAPPSLEDTQKAPG